MFFYDKLPICGSYCLEIAMLVLRPALMLLLTIPCKPVLTSIQRHFFRCCHAT